VRFVSCNSVSHLHVIVDGPISLKWPSSLSTWESFNPEDVKTGIPTTITKQMEAGKLFLHSDLNPIAIAKEQIKGTMVERYLIWLSEEKKKTWTYKNPTTTVPRERKWVLVLETKKYPSFLFQISLSNTFMSSSVIISALNYKPKFYFCGTNLICSDWYEQRRNYYCCYFLE